MNTKNRPLSPFLQIYRPQLTSVVSIFHRITGIGLAVGTLLLVYWLVAAATGPEAYATAQNLIGSFIGRLFLFGWTFALFYHLGNGIRHLVWDAGYGFSMPATYLSGWMVVIGAVVLTIVSWVWGYSVMGGM